MPLLFLRSWIIQFWCPVGYELWKIQGPKHELFQSHFIFVQIWGSPSQSCWWLLFICFFISELSSRFSFRIWIVLHTFELPVKKYFHANVQKYFIFCRFLTLSRFQHPLILCKSSQNTCVLGVSNCIPWILTELKRWW